MNKYHKIRTVYERDSTNSYRTLLDGQWATPEFRYLAGTEWVFTEKIDGTNIRVDWDSEQSIVEFGGRTERAQIPVFLLNQLIQMFPIATFVDLYPTTSMTLYGEGYGARIQKAGANYISPGVDFILFDVQIGGIWLERTNVVDIAHKLSVPIVPIVGMGILRAAVNLATEGFPSLMASNSDYIAEGLVMRPAVELLDRRGQRIITKIKYKDFPR